MTEQIQNELNTIVKTIADTGIASKIILFGSMARGEVTPDSDIDLCVLSPITDRRPRDMKVDLRMAILDILKTPLDCIISPCASTLASRLLHHTVYRVKY